MIAADILADATAAFEDPAFGYGVIHELTIVAHQHHGALIAIDQLFQQLQRFDIQVVCRFIENQQVAGFQKQPRQQQAVTFPARERPHRSHRPFRMEQEVLQIAQHMARLTVNHHLLLTFRKVIHHRPVRIQLCAVLVEVGNFQFGTNVDPPAVGLQLAKHQLQQRGFPTAVGANQGNLVAALDLRGEIFHQHFAINLIVDVLHFENDFAGARSLFNLHPGTAHHFPALAALTTHRLQGANAAFVTRAARFDPLTDPHFFLSELAVEFRILQFFNPQGFFFIQQILIVIARVGHQLAAIEVDDARRHIADKGAVVRNKDNGAFKGFQEPFQPVDGFDIQVVGRFIEQQHARPADQRAAQRRFTQPAAGQGCQLGIGIKAKLLNHFVNAAVQLPQPQVIELLLQARQFI